MAVKDISEMYPITNRFWQYIDNMSLYEYLVSLGADPRSQGFIKGYPGRFYLRVGIYELHYEYRSSLNIQHVSIIKQLMDKDPWHRKFNAFPTYNLLVDSVKYPAHEYYGFEAKGLGSYVANECNCYVMVTTVCGERVFCVDVLN